MAVLMGALKVDAEAEVEMVTVDTHAATGTAQMKRADEMVISIVEVDAIAHVLGAPTDTIDLEAAVIEMMRRVVSQEMTDAIVAQAEVQNENLHLL